MIFIFDDTMKDDP